MKLAIIITTFERDELLFKSVQSIVDNRPMESMVIIVDQGNFTREKQEFLSKWVVFQTLNQKTNNVGTPFYYNTPIYYYQVPYNSGLSYCRNYGVQKANFFKCDRVLISSDSFLVNPTLQWLEVISKELGIFKLTGEHQFDLVGFELGGCVCDWEAKLNLIEGKNFELDFIDKKGSDFYSIFHPIHCRIYRCDIVRNFFIATTESLLKVKWDNNLRLAEHEDFFYRYKQAGYYVGWTNTIKGEKMKDRPEPYNKLRTVNFIQGQEYLKNKYNIKKWVDYKNLERAKS